MLCPYKMDEDTTILCPYTRGILAGYKNPNMLVVENR